MVSRCPRKGPHLTIIALDSVASCHLATTPPEELGSVCRRRLDRLPFHRYLLWGVLSDAPSDLAEEVQPIGVRELQPVLRVGAQHLNPSVVLGRRLLVPLDLAVALGQLLL